MNRPEQFFHIAVADYLRLALPPEIIWYHVPNGGARSRTEGGILKAMGVLAGVPDITVILPHGVAAFIELKSGKGKLTEAQTAFRDRVRGFGCPYAEARTLEDVAGFLGGLIEPFGHRLKVRLAA